MPVRKNKYIGEIYGKLVAVKETTEKRSRCNLWVFSCACGNDVLRTIGDVRKSVKNGGIPSCGCNSSLDLTNKKFGFLTALEKTRVEPGLGWFWNFRCDCGNEIEKIGSHIARNEGAQHCGCKKFVGGNNREDLHNLVFDKLTVVSQNTTDNKGRRRWNCMCACGVLVEDVLGSRLKNGSKTHCGCQKKRGSSAVRFNGYEEISGDFIKRFRNGAKSRNLEFSVTPKFLWELFLSQNRKCALTGEILKFDKPHGDTTASLDRIDSAQGYTEDNVWWVHKRVNVMKWNFSLEEFERTCYAITKYRKLDR